MIIEKKEENKDMEKEIDILLFSFEFQLKVDSKAQDT